jgi:hypothetical protein
MMFAALNCPAFENIFGPEKSRHAVFMTTLLSIRRGKALLRLFDTCVMQDGLEFKVNQLIKGQAPL